MYNNERSSDRRFVEVLGYRIFASDKAALNEILCEIFDTPRKRKKFAVMCINPHSHIAAKYNSGCKKSLDSADILIADGVGITLAGKVFSKNMHRITGDDLFHTVMHVANSKKLRVFFLGSTTETIISLQRAVQTDYPNVASVSGMSPPFADVFTDEQNSQMIARVNEFRPDVLWVGLTAPKQELWIEKNKEDLEVQLIGAIGAVFDFYSGNVQRAPKWARDFGLEWIVRLVNSPLKMWRRTFISTPLFLADIIRNYIKNCMRNF